MSLTDSYCTPEWLADRVGTFDFDPCWNPLSHIRATDFAYLENGDNGLFLPWYGRVWLNHPYSDPLPWMEKLQRERGDLRCTESLVLAKLDVSTAWWARLTDPMHGPFDAWMFKKRLQFDPPPGVKTSSNNFCSVLVHHRDSAPRLDLHDVAVLWNIVR